ncbi:MAG: DnaJ domain-containing protein [Dehalococcoidia bacterium]
MGKPDYYATLQVHPEADREVVVAAYRRLAAKYHPDVSTSPDAAEKMKQLNEAYEVLSDPARRAAYDRSSRVTPVRKLPSRRGWGWLIVPVGLLVFILLAARLGPGIIKLALVILVLVVVIWLVSRLMK